MKQDKQESSDNVKFVEQDTLGPPDNYFYVDEELATTLSGFADKSFLIGGSGYAQFTDYSER